MQCISGHVFPAVHLTYKAGMCNLDSDRNRIGRDPAFRRSDDQSSAENFGGAFAVQFNREKKPHLYCGSRLQGPIRANEHSGDADVFSHSFVPFPLAPHPIPD
jgi:hypothetical protein